jgi:GTPase Era involved in 16S rRNA processing
MEKNSSILPNTTQVPHIIIREWMPLLKDVELRVLLVITDQTLGWIEDIATGRRKEEDWIAHSQLVRKTGRSTRAISYAIRKLADELNIIEVYDEQKNILDSAAKRMKCGDKLFYRLALKHPQPTLFDTSAKSAGVAKKEEPLQKVRAQKVRATKETVPTKANMRTAKTPSAHRQFMVFWNDEVARARGIKAIITGKDGKNLKRVIDLGVSQQTLEQAAVYFLNDYGFRKFAPSISTFLSAGILNGLLDRMRNDPDFWKKLDGYTVKSGRVITRTTDFAAQLEKLRAGFVMPISPQERARIVEEVASAERAIK